MDEEHDSPHVDEGELGRRVDGEGDGGFHQEVLITVIDGEFTEARMTEDGAGNRVTETKVLAEAQVQTLLTQTDEAQDLEETESAHVDARWTPAMFRDPQKPWLLKPAITNIAGGPASSSSGAQAPPELVTTGQSTEYIAEMTEAEMRIPTPRDSEVESAGS